MQNKIEIKFSEKLVFGELYAEEPCSISAVTRGKCTVGFLSYVGRSSELYNSNIGRFCSIAPGCFFGPTNHPLDRLSSHLFSFNNHGPFKESAIFKDWMRTNKYDGNDGVVEIGNDCWIGRNVTIKRGVKVGDGAVIGANCVVVKDVPPYAIMGGVPAKIIRFRFPDYVIEKLLNLKWWNYQIDKKNMPNLDVTNIENSISMIDDFILEGKISKLNPKKYLIKVGANPLLMSS